MEFLLHCLATLNRLESDSNAFYYRDTIIAIKNLMKTEQQELNRQRRDL